MKLFGALILGLVLLISCSKENVAFDQEENQNDNLDESFLSGGALGIASNYVNDAGIENNPFVLAVENFETGQVTIPTQEDRYKKNVKVVMSPALNGKYSGEHSWASGVEGPTCRFTIPAKAHVGEKPTYFVRMYFRFDSSFHPGDGMEPIGVKGFGIYNESASTSEPCNGKNWYSVACQFTGWGPSAKSDANNKYLWFGHMYSYSPQAANAKAAKGEIKLTNFGDGIPSYRFSIYSNPYFYIKFDQWYCYEVGLYLNNPGKSDGEAKFWINGVLQSHATNLRFRDIEDLKPQTVHLNLHRTTPNFPHTMKRYVDNIVIATRYIGPMKGK